MYGDEIKEQVLKLHLEQRRTIISLTDEFGISKNAIGKWVNDYRKGCCAE